MTIPDFGTLFIASKGSPIEYRGQTLIMGDKVAARLGERFHVTIESTDSPYPQGVGISDGVSIFGEKTKRAVVWEYFSLLPAERGERRSALPFSFDVECRNRAGYLWFYNMTEVDRRHEWWVRGHAMIATPLPQGARYRCNDFAPDDDFSDMVFTVIRLS